MADLPYKLKHLFEMCKFQGQVTYPTNENGDETTNFLLDIFKFDPKTGLFVADGEDEFGLSGIVGNVEPKDTANCGIKFRQLHLAIQYPYLHEGILTKENGQVIMIGSYNPGCKTYAWRFEIFPKEIICYDQNFAAMVDLSKMQ